MNNDRNMKTNKLKKKKKKICVFCQNKKTLDYKDTANVRRFVSDRAKILSRRSTGCCALHQRMVAKVIKKAREVGLLPYTVE